MLLYKKLRNTHAAAAAATVLLPSLGAANFLHSGVVFCIDLKAPHMRHWGLEARGDVASRLMLWVGIFTGIVISRALVP